MPLRTTESELRRADRLLRQGFVDAALIVAWVATRPGFKGRQPGDFVAWARVAGCFIGGAA